ncbi:zinc finger MYM-type protein 1 [Ooceraea biroi]|nr:zinc finger MYM-type protein 1 [Ooceraea biroi]
MAFRGTSDKLYTPNNGKFLGLVQLIGKFDPIMQEHLKLAMAGDISDHYCGKDIQNELIDLMGGKVKSEIVSRAKTSKYYSIIADCTPDISHIEQLSLTIRFADLSDDNISIKEHFLEFILVQSSSGAGLTEVILTVLNKHGLELHNCRGQGYDNGANMKGKNIGVQKRILDLNPLAFFVPCGCHSYNLVLCDAAKSSVKSVTLFGVLQRLFALFSASVNRWKILTDHLGLYSLKKLSDTRWEAKINSVKAVRYQICDVHDALVTLANETEKSDVTISHEAITLAGQLKDFGFIVSLVVWYEILFQINVVSKSLQSKNIDLGKCTEILENCCNFLEEYRKTGFKKALLIASDLAKELQIEPVFKPMNRVQRIKRQAGEMATDEPIESSEKKFEIEFFNKLLDTSLMSMKERFKQLHDYSKTWSFLYNVKKIPERNELLKLCTDLQRKLTVGSDSDIDGHLLCDELISLKDFLPDNDDITPIYVLNFIKQRNIHELYPNIWIALRILVTIPVTVASGERSFSKLNPLTPESPKFSAYFRFS